MAYFINDLVIREFAIAFSIKHLVIMAFIMAYFMAFDIKDYITEFIIIISSMTFSYYHIITNSMTFSYYHMIARFIDFMKYSCFIINSQHKAFIDYITRVFVIASFIVTSTIDRIAVASFITISVASIMQILAIIAFLTYFKLACSNNHINQQFDYLFMGSS